MAKMFYTLEEAASKLGKSVDDVKTMAEKGQLQEFRDRDRLMFKVDQVDLLARTMDIAHRQVLSAYDAAYVELAGRLGIPLATFDARLRKACKALKLGVMP